MVLGDTICACADLDNIAVGREQKQCKPRLKIGTFTTMVLMMIACGSCSYSSSTSGMSCDKHFASSSCRRGSNGGRGMTMIGVFRSLELQSSRICTVYQS